MAICWVENFPNAGLEINILSFSSVMVWSGTEEKAPAQRFGCFTQDVMTFTWEGDADVPSEGKEMLHNS